MHEIGTEEFSRRVEEEWAQLKDGALTLDDAAIDAIRAHFQVPDFEALDDGGPELAAALQDPAFARWHANAVAPHRMPGHAIVTQSLKPVGGPPGDATADQMDAIADLAERYAYGEIRVAHEQNLTLPHVRQKDLPALWKCWTRRAGHAQYRAHLRHHRLPGPGLLLPGQCPLHSLGAGSDQALRQQ